MTQEHSLKKKGGASKNSKWFCSKFSLLVVIRWPNIQDTCFQNYVKNRSLINRKVPNHGQKMALKLSSAPNAHCWWWIVVVLTEHNTRVSIAHEDAFVHHSISWGDVKGRITTLHSTIIFTIIFVFKMREHYIIKRSTRGHCFAIVVPLTIWKVEDYQIVS